MSRVPARIGLYRFPYGACNADALRTVAEQGLLAIQWDVSMADPVLGQTSDRIVNVVMRKVRPGSIIIGHANGRGVHTSEALAILVPKLKAEGYQFVSVSELLAAGDPEITQECYDERPGDVNRYDKPRTTAVPGQGIGVAPLVPGSG
jgi:peptidoglycan/xylan/chitin deacetylase (PgdA/CDA1 family)